MFTRLIATGLLLAVCMPLADGQDDDRRGRRRDRDRGMDRGSRRGFGGGPPGGERESRGRFGGMLEARGFKLESGESVDTARGRRRQRFEDKRRERGLRNDDSSDNGRANRSTPPSAFKPRDRKRITVDLPKSYVEIDSDLDRQIGLYEWIVARRKDLELFDDIDRNADGLLTPKELTAWDKLKDAADETSLTATKRERLLIVDGSVTPSAEKPTDRRDRGRFRSDDGGDRGRSRGERSFGRRNRSRD